MKFLTLLFAFVAAFFCNDAVAQGRFFDVRLGFVQMSNSSGTSLFSDIQAPQSVPSMGFSIGWPASDHSTLGVVYSCDFSNFIRPTFNESYGLNKLCGELLTYKDIMPDVTCIYGFALGAMLASNTVTAGVVTDTYNRFGVVIAPKLGVGYRLDDTRIGVVYEWCAGAFLSKKYDVPQNIGLPTVGGRGYWGHSLTLTVARYF
ncbi:MAG: hypothetical protein SPJ13_04150 [Bacteroidales bacterium]|nr:hypothetical protein [Bacteroidales bacterium]